MFPGLAPSSPSVVQSESLVIEGTSDFAKLVAWRIDMLVILGSFDTSYAGQIASIHNLDYRQAVELHHCGATQQQVFEILREN